MIAVAFVEQIGYLAGAAAAAAMSAQTHRFRVSAEDTALRLDQLLAKYVPGLSRRKARVALDIGAVFVDRARVKVAGRVLRAGQEVTVTLGGVLERATGEVGAANRARDQEQLPAHQIVFVDAAIVVVNKPAGLVTAPTPESDRGNLLDVLCRSELGHVHMVHRIDMPTSGLLVFARTPATNKALGDAFVRHDITRAYTAVVAGQVASQTIDRPIAGRRAVTHITTTNTYADATVLTARLETGRTHQIRLHCAGLGHPVLGDQKHGGERTRTYRPHAPRMMLHAQTLGFAHPVTGQYVEFVAPPPPEFEAYVARLAGSDGSASDSST